MEKVGEICLILLGEAPNEIKHISPTFSLHDERGFVHVLLLLLLVLLGLNAIFLFCQTCQGRIGFGISVI